MPQLLKQMRHQRQGHLTVLAHVSTARRTAGPLLAASYRWPGLCPSHRRAPSHCLGGRYSATADVSCHSGPMPYVVTPTGPLCFQVSAVGTAKHGLIADFASLAEAEAFVASMRRLDAGRTYSMDGPKEPC